MCVSMKDGSKEALFYATGPTGERERKQKNESGGGEINKYAKASF